LAWAFVLLGFTSHGGSLFAAGFLGAEFLTLGVLLVALPLPLRDLIKPLTRRHGLVALGISICVLTWNIHSFATWDL
jgi:hypothetical protein